MYTNRIKKSLTKLLGIVALLALSLPGYANIDSVKASQLNLDLETGSTAFGIKGEGLIPLYLKPNKAIYTDLEGSYDTKSKGYSIELGGGYRQIEDINLGKYFHKNMILGGYAFLDMTRAKGAEKHRTLLEGNIGGELYNATESLSINAYIPLSKHKWTDETEWGSANQEIIEGHSLYDTKYRLTELTPNWGLDIEAGHTIPIPGAKNNLKGYLGGYYENQDKGQNSDGKTKGSIKGISAKATYQINKYIMVEAQDSYDNYNNNEIMVEAKVTLGKSETNGLEEELLQGVNHNIAGAGIAGTVDTLTTEKQEVTQGSETVEGKTDLFQEEGHIYFFNQTGSSNANGTYENPYSYADLTNGTLSQIAGENPDYSHIFVTGTTPTNIGELTLGANESLEGRYGSDNGYENAATLANEAEMPTLKGSLILEGGSEAHPQEVSGVKLYNEEGKYSVGIQAGGASNGATYIELNQMQLGESTASGNTNNYETGINVKGGANISAIGSNLNATQNGIVVGTGETAGVITVGEGTTVSARMGLSNVGEIKNINVEGKMEGLAFGLYNVGEIKNIKVEGMIKGDIDGLVNSQNGKIESIEGGSEKQAEGTIEGGGAYGIVNSSLAPVGIGKIAYLSKVSGGIDGIRVSQGSVNEINNSGTISGITVGDTQLLAGAVGTIVNSGTISRITNTTRGTITGVTNEADGTIATLDNSKEMGTIDNLGTINSVTNEADGTITTLDNSKEMGTIDNLGTITGVTNEADGTIATLDNSKEMGTIDNSGTISGITNGANGTITTIDNGKDMGTIDNSGTIGSSGVEVGIKNEGIIGNVINLHTGVITGSEYAISSGMDSSTVKIGSIINTGLIGGANTESGVLLLGQAGDLTGVNSSDLGYVGTIEGSDFAISMFGNSTTVTNISHLDLIGGISLEGTVGDIEDNTIEASAMNRGNAIFANWGEPVIIGDIKGNTFKNFFSAAFVFTGSTIQNASTFTADNTFDNVANTGISYGN